MSKLHVLGSGGYHPSEARQTTCLMIPEAGLVFDAGTGFFRVRDHVATKTLDIYLSHAHLDHCCGLTYLLDVLWEKPMDRVTLHGRPEDLAVVQHGLFESPLFPLRFSYHLEAIEMSMSVGNWTIRCRPQLHPGGTLGYRMDGPGRSWAFVTDTTADADDVAQVEFLRGVDLLLHECHFSDAYIELARKSGHSSATAVGQLAQAAGIGELALIHINPLESAAELSTMTDRVREVFPKTVLCTDSQTFDLG